VLGDPNTEDGRQALRRSSPLHFVHQATNPVLVVQGEQDSRVPVEQASLMVEALQQSGAPVTYVLFPDEGHGVVRPDNARLFYALVENFFGQCLGGRFEPITADLAGSSAVVPVGAELLPGLQSVLASDPEEIE
jgi:dipeptidyl aminopeptidase/acylaminoacyl peptidase